jgi:hypothetical protein
VTKLTPRTKVPRTPEAFTHDADGIRNDDARWHWTWDGSKTRQRADCQAGRLTRQGEASGRPWGGETR